MKAPKFTETLHEIEHFGADARPIGSTRPFVQREGGESGRHERAAEGSMRPSAFVRVAASAS
jgi:hypothetical protein